MVGDLLRNVKTTGTYELSTKNLNFAELYKYNLNSFFSTTTSSKGTGTITKLDLANNIISGTFQFTAEDNENPQNTVNVTDGWFDITYQ